jgi:hypothetical protein
VAVGKKDRIQFAPLGGLRQVLVVTDIPQPFDRRPGMPPGPSMMAATEYKQVQVHHACGHGLRCPPLRTTRCAFTVSGAYPHRGPALALPCLHLSPAGVPHLQHGFDRFPCQHVRHRVMDRRVRIVPARVTPSVACRRGRVRSSTAERPGRH